jgi:hypothetical protein
MSVGDGMAVQAMMNGVPFIPSTTVSGTPGNAASSPPVVNGTGTGAGPGSATQTPRISTNAGDGQQTSAAHVVLVLACAVMALLAVK